MVKCRQDSPFNLWTLSSIPDRVQGGNRIIYAIENLLQNVPDWCSNVRKVFNHIVVARIYPILSFLSRIFQLKNKTSATLIHNMYWRSLEAALTAETASFYYTLHLVSSWTSGLLITAKFFSFYACCYWVESWEEDSMGCWLLGFLSFNSGHTAENSNYQLPACFDESAKQGPFCIWQGCARGRLRIWQHFGPVMA